MKKSLIIIGAGASGLLAANELAALFDITILEANDRTGGRINSIRKEENIIEGGAEFIHGNLPLSFKLLKKAGIDYIPVEGKMYRKSNGQFIEQEDIIPGWDKLLKKMKQVKEDITLQQFLFKSFPGEDNLSFRERIIAYAEGFDLVDAGKASIMALYKEWSAESEDNYRIPSGYTALTDWLTQRAIQRGCKVLLNKKINKIDWQKDAIAAHTDSNEIFYADKLLVTVPVSLLQQSNKEKLEFDPPVTEYTDAANNIGFGTVVKIALEFKQPFWKPDAGFIFSGEKYFPTWWTQLPAITNLLTGWAGGPTAVEISNETAESILLKALRTLSAIFDLPVEQLRNELINIELFNWKNSPYAGGAYSYNTVYAETAKRILNGPIADTIFFAGEALYSGDHPGTVEAAFHNGKEVAKRLKDSFKN